MLRIRILRLEGKKKRKKKRILRLGKMYLYFTKDRFSPRFWDQSGQHGEIPKWRYLCIFRGNNEFLPNMKYYFLVGLDVDGIYRVSGNLAVIQKLRFAVNHGKRACLPACFQQHCRSLKNWFKAILKMSYCYCFSDEKLDLNDSKWEDIHVVTGALKMFFRELPEPLFTFSHFNDFVNAISKYVLLLSFSPPPILKIIFTN